MLADESSMTIVEVYKSFRKYNKKLKVEIHLKVLLSFLSENAKVVIRLLFLLGFSYKKAEGGKPPRDFATVVLENGQGGHSPTVLARCKNACSSLEQGWSIIKKHTPA